MNEKMKKKIYRIVFYVFLKAAITIGETWTMTGIGRKCSSFVVIVVWIWVAVWRGIAVVDGVFARRWMVNAAFGFFLKRIVVRLVYARHGQWTFIRFGLSLFYFNFTKNNNNMNIKFLWNLISEIDATFELEPLT